MNVYKTCDNTGVQIPDVRAIILGSMAGRTFNNNQPTYLFQEKTISEHIQPKSSRSHGAVLSCRRQSPGGGKAHHLQEREYGEKMKRGSGSPAAPIWDVWRCEQKGWEIEMEHDILNGEQMYANSSYASKIFVGNYFSGRDGGEAEENAHDYLSGK